MNKRLKKILLSLTISSCVLFPSYSYAASEDIDAQIREQQRILQELNSKKAENNSKEMQKKLDALDKELKALSKASKKPSYDAKGAIDAISRQILELRQQIEATTKSQERIAELLDKLESRSKDREADIQIARAEQDIAAASGNTNRYLINPGSNAKVGYTQDAINSQGNSTMVFAYYPDQLYKIYCRKGYLTDLEFKKGETIKFVGGGDTSGWMVNNTEVDGVPHLYIKPVVDVSTTNLIVTTNKRSYQLIVNVSDWYNPMVRWSYGAEDREVNLIKQQKEERITTGKIKGNVETLDFNYKVEGKGKKPTMIFSDGEQTYIKFEFAPTKKVPLFVREKGKKQMALVNYRIKDNYYIIEKVFDTAQLRFSEDEILTIKHK